MSRGDLKITRHHILPVSRQGKTIRSNILRLKAYKHRVWHLVFKNKTLEEVIMLLIRVHRAKKRCLKPCPLCRLTME